MEIKLKRIFVANKDGKFMAIDRASGYPWITNDLGQALICREDDEAGVKNLQSYVRGFSENDFKVVTATITFEL